MKAYFKKRIVFLSLIALIFLFFITSVNVYTQETNTGFDKQIQETLNKFLKTGAPPNLNISQIIDLIKLINIGSPSGDISGKVIDMGKEQFEKGDKTGAIELFKYALEGLNKGGDNKALIEGLENIGKFFEQKGDKSNAIEFLLKAVDASVLGKDQPGLSELLKNLEPLLVWQETQGSIPLRVNTKEEEKQAGTIEIAKITLPDGKVATIIIPKLPETDKKVPQGAEKKPDKDAKINTTGKEDVYVVEKTTLQGDVLSCTGPKIPNLYAYEDMLVQKEWSLKYINPVPGGRYAPYAGDTGLDIIAPRGYPFFAAKSGVILYTSPAGHCRQKGPKDDQGAMRIHHPDGTDTFYAHLSGRNAALKAGSIVTQGQWMGNIGTANNVPHLHFTIYYSGGRNEPSFSTPGKLYNPWKVVAMIIKIWLKDLF